MFPHLYYHDNMCEQGATICAPLASKKVVPSIYLLDTNIFSCTLLHHHSHLHSITLPSHGVFCKYRIQAFHHKEDQ